MRLVAVQGTAFMDISRVIYSCLVAAQLTVCGTFPVLVSPLVRGRSRNVSGSVPQKQ